MSSASGGNAVEQSELFDKLDVAFTTILIIAGILTFPPACFVYWRMLTLKTFKGQYLMKLFVLNGASNMLIYTVQMISIQFSNWPSFFGFYSWLRNTPLCSFLRFMQDFSKCFMWQTTFFISLNRLFSLVNQNQLKKYEFNYFILATIFSLLASFLISFPLFFSNYAYVQWTSTPAMAHQLSLAGGTLAVNVLISFYLMRMRKEYSTKMKSRPEQGLLLSSFVALLMHVMNELLKIAAKTFNDDMISYFITLTMAISTTLPFWTMIGFAHSLRRAVLSGSGFDRTISTVRGRSAKKKRGVTVSAAF